MFIINSDESKTITINQYQSLMFFSEIKKKKTICQQKLQP